jgi:hypothetical protein
MLLEAMARMGDEEVASSLWWLDDENVDPNGSS